MLQNFASQYPTKASLVEIGKSEGGILIEILLISISF
jgi:hypothetical protein